MMKDAPAQQARDTASFQHTRSEEPARRPMMTPRLERLGGFREVTTQLVGTFTP